MKEELLKMYRYLSFWVAAIGAAIVAGWQMMPADLQAKLFEAMPWLQAVAPLVWLGAFVLARAAPQPGLDAPKQE